MKNLFFGILMTALITSCSYRIMDFTLISSKNVELSKFPTYEKGQTRAEGKDTKPIIFVFPTGRPDGKEAIDRAIESTPGAVALLDGVLIYKYFYIPYIYGEYIYVVEGTPLIDPDLANLENINQLEDYSICLLDKNGDVLKSVNLEEEEYRSAREELFNSPKSVYKKMIQ